MKDYGKEVVLDLHECDPGRFTRKHIRNYFKELCRLIDMERCKLTWWDDLHTPEEEKQTEPHLVGTSAVQFIKTSNITIHTLPLLRKAFVNVFSCKDLDAMLVEVFSQRWFEAQKAYATVVRRR